MPFGPNGIALNSSYQSRESPQYMSDLGNAVANFARLVPDGLLVFFPSYHVLEKCTNHWKSDINNGADAFPRLSPRIPTLLNRTYTRRWPLLLARVSQHWVQTALRGIMLALGS